LETNRIFQATGFAIDRSLNYPELVNSFLEQQRDRQNKQIIGATVHRHYERWVKIWPTALATPRFLGLRWTLVVKCLGIKKYENERIGSKMIDKVC